MPDQYYPPLKTWIISGTLFLVLFLTFHLLGLCYNKDLVRKKQKLEAAYLLQHALEYLHKNENKTKVMALGSSLTAQGIACEEEMADTAYSQIALSKVFLSTYYEIVESFLEAKVFDSLLKKPPAILLIELDLLAYRIIEDTSFSDRTRESAFFIQNLKTTIAYRLANYRMPANQGKIIDATIEDTLSPSNISWEVRSYEDLSFIHPYLKRLRAAGVRIILLQIPRPAEIETLLHDKRKDQQLQKLLDSYKLRYQMDYWNYPDKLPYAYFYDQGHLNKKGRMVYSKWLYTKLEKEIR